MLNVAIGYDPRESVAAYVAAHSIYRRSSRPVQVTLLHKATMPYWRERDPRQSTDFAFSRFLVPYLYNYEGHTLWMDADMLVLCDVAEIFAYADERHAVHVVKHDYTPKTATKFLGAKQTVYPRKNWSSVVLFNNAACKKLTPEFVNTASGATLHQFEWLHDSQIGSLPAEYNHLVGEYEPIPDPKILHYTLGGPYFKAYSNCAYAKEWFDEFQDMNRVDD